MKKQQFDHRSKINKELQITIMKEKTILFMHEDGNKIKRNNLQPTLVYRDDFLKQVELET